MAGCCFRFGVLALVLWLAPSAVLAQTRVACVGDSITYGYGLGDREREAYPSVLAELLGSEFEVGNFGDSGSTLQEAGDKPWRAQTVYAQCLAFAPDVVVIMLGTNDAKPANWSEAGFVADYQALIGEFRDLGASVVVATPPPVVPPGAFQIQADVVNETVTALVRQLAQDEGATLVDVYAALEDRPELLPDSVHPSAAGARLIAETVADVLLAPAETTTTATSTTSTTGTTSSPTAASSDTSSSTGGSGGAMGTGGADLTTSAVTTTSTTTNTTGIGAGGEGGVTAQAAVSTTSMEPTSLGPASSTQTSTLTASTTGGGSGAPTAAESPDEGCACSLGAATRRHAAAFWPLLFAPLLYRRRRRPA